MKKNLIITIIVVIVVGAAAFYGGNLYGQNAAKTAATAAAASFRGAGAAFRGTTAGRGAMGQILTVDSQSITVSVTGGGSKLILYSPDTKISKTVNGATSDLAVGTNIVATGTTNSDGSVTATDIQIRPAGAPGANGNTNAPVPTPTK